MKPVVIYSSRTGNTKRVAEAMHAALPAGTPLIPVGEFRDAENFDLVFMGYWVDRGTADAAARDVMAKITGKPVGLFSTLGAYPDSVHAGASLANGARCLGDDCKVLGTFICQGAIAQELQDRMKQFPPDHPHAVTPERRKRWEDASTHPDAADCEKATAFAREVFEVGKKLHRY